MKNLKLKPIAFIAILLATTVAQTLVPAEAASAAIK